MISSFIIILPGRSITRFHLTDEKSEAHSGWVTDSDVTAKWLSQELEPGLPYWSFLRGEKISSTTFGSPGKRQVRLTKNW